MTDRKDTIHRSLKKQVKSILLRTKHKYNFFLNSTTGVCTQKIHRIWGSAKLCNKKQWGTAWYHLKGYLTEFMWGKSFSWIIKNNFGNMAYNVKT